jgi:hypothetical protein
VKALTTLLYDMIVRNYHPNQPLEIMPAIVTFFRLCPCYATTKAYLPSTLYKVNLNTGEIKRADESEARTNAVFEGLANERKGVLLN